MKTPKDWFDAAVVITPGFEVSGDPYLGVSGDFDGMGISCGVLQWNIGMYSLQPMVKAIGKAAILNAMPNFGSQMWIVCNGTKAKALKIVRGWQNNKKLKPLPKKELRALMGSKAMRNEQIRKIGIIADRALHAANKWAKKSKGGTANKKLFCWFFDLLTQNGGLEGLTPHRVNKFITNNKPDKADDFVCDFLESRTGSSGHVKDANRNGNDWRDNTTNETLEILIMSFLRAQTSKPKWQHVVLNRKGTIAMGGGWVNGAEWSFSSLGL